MLASGRTTPSAKLDVNGVINSGSIYITGAGTASPAPSDPYLRLYYYATKDLGRMYSIDGSNYKSMAFGDWNSESPPLFLGVGGYLGVNWDVDEVDHNLQIGGDGFIEDGLVIGTTFETATVETNGLLIEGNVGIGTATPGEKLEVSGNISLTKGAIRSIYVAPQTTDASGNDLKVYAGDAKICFPGNTKINTPGGYKLISDINSGDILLAYNPETQHFSETNVVSIWSIMADSYYVLNDGLKVTAEHPFFTGSGWKTARQLAVGDELFTVEGRWIVLESKFEVDEEIEVYNMHVGAPNTFFAEDILVHNKSAAKIGGDLYLFGGEHAGISATTGSDGDVILAHTGSAALGNVGIGTSAPLAQLHTTSSVRFAGLGGSGAHLTINTNGDITRTTITGGGVTGSGTNNQVAFWTGSPATLTSSGNLIWDNTNARLGIGVTPDYRFHVVGPSVPTSTGYLAYFRLQGGSDLYGTVRMEDGGAAGATGPVLDVEKYGTGPSAIFNGGNVGIGTTSPNTELEVNFVNAVASDMSNGLTIANDTRLFVGATGYYAGISFATYKAEYPKQYIGVVREASGGIGDIVFCNLNNNGDVAVSSSNEVMRIDHFGNVGIGTTSPMVRTQINQSAGQSLLLVRDDTAISSGDQLGGIGFDGRDGNVPDDIRESSASIIAFASEAHGTGDKGGHLTFWTSPTDQNDDTDGLERMRIDQAGNVGIGTTSPSTKLHVVGPNQTGTSGIAALDVLNVTGGKGGPYNYGTGGKGSDIFLTGGAGGNGTSVPSWGGAGGDITINGGAGGTGIVAGGSYGNILLASSGGKVGIGTASPTADLDVDGTAAIGDLEVERAASIGEGLDVIGPITAKGTITGKMKHFTHHTYASYDAAADYIPFPGDVTESASITSYLVRWIAPYSGRLVKVLIEYTGITGNTTISFCKNRSTTAVETETVNISVANKRFTATFSTATFSAGDELHIRVDPTSDYGTLYPTITCVWEYDTN